jgi:integrase
VRTGRSLPPRVYAGLRRGDLTALRWEDVDLAEGVIRVRRGWDHVEGEIAPKSREGRRNVPVPAPLREVLLEHSMSTPDRMRVFRSASWVNEAVRRARHTFAVAELTPVDLHTCRHTCASFLIAAGVNVKAVQGFLGHANIRVTLDFYGTSCPARRPKRPRCSKRSSPGGPAQ